MELNKKIEGILGLSAIGDAMGATTENLTFGQIREMFTAPVTTFQKPGKTAFALGNEAGEITDDFSQIYMLSKAILRNKGRITTVSYTHLDVYKRQHLHRSTARSKHQRWVSPYIPHTHIP